jgi:ankyrin repeat protein
MRHQTPLHSASLYGRFDIVRLLFEHGATANSQDWFGRTPLHLVAEGEYNFEQDRIRTAQLLLERGADANAQDEDGATPLHLASYRGRVEIARALLNRGAAANLMSNQGRTPLHCVTLCRYLYDDGIRVAQLLLERGADANAPDEDKRTPLHLASYDGKVEIARVLLDGGAGVNSKDDQGWAPLHVVANGYSGDNDVLVAQLLLERGADVNAPDDASQTPLHLASNSGRIKMVLVLLNAGANASAKDAQDQTPYHVVSQGPHGSPGDVVGIARLLLQCGADVNAQHINHTTPSDSASEDGLEIKSLSLHHGYPQTQCEGVIEINVEQSPTSSTNSLIASVEASGYVREGRLPPRLPYLPSCCRTLVFCAHMT